MYNPIQIANKFIELGVMNGSPITQMKAQKLTYIAHGISLGFYNKTLLSTPVCAWRYGPVVPSLYNLLKDNGSSLIMKPVQLSATFMAPLDHHTDQMLTSVFNFYNNYSAEQLSDFTHREGTPWYEATKIGADIISDESIQSYYRRLLNKDPNCIGL
ncbi:TPA: Panacea domain-containing protein [Yersinia enterocolitica]|nr:DUF4065 domain-containing protein [Yersinia enterocolitica]HEI6832176.1 DUF4065 domain-containing protein [Yersinia enterocolitica]HEI6939578.1 DUF4065 domain-containing protein [Yersinia enterocolitica]